MRIMYLILISLVISVGLYSDSISDKLFDKLHNTLCDKIVDSGIYKTCYSYNNKGPLIVAYTVNKDKVDVLNLKNNIKWKVAYTIPKEYRQHNSDYYSTGYDKGHLAADRYFDYNIDTVKKTYILGLNSVPMSINLNRSRWRKAENRVIKLLDKYPYVNVIDIMVYSDKTIGNGVHIPKTLFKLLYNKDIKECYKYNGLDVKVYNDKLSMHKVPCGNIVVISKIKILQ